eukprot:456277-Amphidinium_carterae.1
MLLGNEKRPIFIHMETWLCVYSGATKAEGHSMWLLASLTCNHVCLWNKTEARQACTAWPYENKLVLHMLSSSLSKDVTILLCLRMGLVLLQHCE